MAYGNFIENLGKEYEAHLAKIQSEYNFDNGQEFEVAICNTLRRALPPKFGVCRGFVVNKEGEKAGDDVIIYAADRFPTLRMIDPNDYSQKQQIPIEGVYAYIEAKHSLTFEESGTMAKAVQQVTDVRALAEKRERVGVEESLDPYLTLRLQNITTPDGFPKYVNPLFTAIIGNKVRPHSGADPVTGKEARELVATKGIAPPPDLVIATGDIVCLPVHRKGDDGMFLSPFWEPGKSIDVQLRPGMAFALGFCSMMLALDYIRLGKMHWYDILGDASGAAIIDKKSWENR